MKPFFYTTFALTAFAFNSILCRLALRGEEAGAVGFTLVRLFSGALMLAVITGFLSVRKAGKTLDARMVKLDNGSWLSAFFLFGYAIAFSLAYLDLTAATGALILFGSVQLTIIAVSLVRGERPPLLEWLGLLFAVGGLVYLVFPGLASPPLQSSLLMAAAGASWGFYTLRGKGRTDPLAVTTGNFVRSVPMIALIAIPFFAKIHLSNRGIILAIISGAVTSGIGYAVWYAALKFHPPTRAAVLQLSVPVIAAVCGIVFLAETFSKRLLVAGIMIILGIGMTIFGKKS